MIRATSAIVFDLDDTLYLERDYVRSGFAAVGDWLRRDHGIMDFAAAAWARFETGRRGTIFDAALVDTGTAPEPGLIAAMVETYRRHTPHIALQPDAAAWLAAPPPGIALALLTDGPVASQSAKIAALGLHVLNPRVMTDSWGPQFRKPDPRGFLHIEQELGIAGAACTYVGDNATKDFIAPRRLGWRTVQIVRPGALHAGPPMSPRHAANVTITSLAELAAALRLPEAALA